MAGKILGKLRGLIASAEERSRNNRDYTENFWDGIFGSDMFAEGIENKMFFGELWHPEDEGQYGEIHPDDRAAVVLTNVDKKGLNYYGDFDILPTRAGEVLKNLIDIGCTFGVSSRGYSDYETSVFDDPNSFDLITFDIVAFPGIKSARLHPVGAVAESYSNKNRKNRTKIMESLKNEIDSGDELGKFVKDTLKAKEGFDDTIHIEELQGLGIYDEDYYEYLTVIETNNKGVAFYDDGEHGKAAVDYVIGDLEPNSKYIVDNLYYDELKDTYTIIDDAVKIS